LKLFESSFDSSAFLGLAPSSLLDQEKKYEGNCPVFWFGLFVNYRASCSLEKTSMQPRVTQEDEDAPSQKKIYLTASAATAIFLL